MTPTTAAAAAAATTISSSEPDPADSTVANFSPVAVPEATLAVTEHDAAPTLAGGLYVVVGPLSGESDPQVVVHVMFAPVTAFPNASFTVAVNVALPPGPTDADEDVMVITNGVAGRTVTGTLAVRPPDSAVTVQEVPGDPDAVTPVVAAKTAETAPQVEDHATATPLCRWPFAPSTAALNRDVLPCSICAVVGVIEIDTGAP
jgi:hypothetical protein